MRRWLLIIFIAFAWSCKPDEDPGPDLSGTISFTFSGAINNVAQVPMPTYYIVISDTSGNVLEWKKLVDNESTPMPFPPGDSKLANVTIITTRTYSTGDRSTTLDTYTGIVGDDYYNMTNFVDLPIIRPDTKYEVTIPNRSNYKIATVYITNAALRDYSEQNDTLTATYGIDGVANNLFVLLQRNDPFQSRYLYNPDINEGKLMLVPDDFETLEEVDAHVLFYPDHAEKMDWSLGIINGMNGHISYSLDFVQWEELEPTIVRYPEIPNLFPEYETIVVGIGKHGESYVTDFIDTSIKTSITTLQTEVVRHESFTTKRIAADLSGDGDVIFLSDGWGQAENSVSWNVYTPMTSKLRVNPPQFPDDLLKELPALEGTKDQSFNQLSLDDYNMTYTEFYTARLKGNTSFRPRQLQSTVYAVDQLDAGRRTTDVHQILKRYGIKAPAF